jgi:hypothetical protein
MRDEKHLRDGAGVAGTRSAPITLCDYAYYVEVQLWKAEVTNDPRVVGLRIVARVYL